MIYSIFGFDFNFDIKIHQMLLLASSLGLYVRLLLSIVSSQSWLKTYSQYLVFSILPITGYLITSVISNNIALSLGMVGALSIVRFRTPVKNPSELVIYFSLITIGIVVNVNPNIAINFVFFLTFIVMLTELFRFLSIKLKLNPFNSVNENFLMLTILSTAKNKDAEENQELVHISFEQNYMYKFKSEYRDNLINILDTFEKSSIISYSIDAYE